MEYYIWQSEDYHSPENNLLTESFDINSPSWKYNPFIEKQESKSYQITDQKNEIDDKKENEENCAGNLWRKTNKFLSKKRKKPGRKPKIGKIKLIKEHDKNEPTNILKKVITHFLTFLIDFSNDLIKSIFSEQEYKNIFLQIDHQKKTQIKLKSKRSPPIKQFKEIFDFPISQKNLGIKRKEKINETKEKHNKNVYEDITKLCPKLEEFFDQNILDVFVKYFCKDKTEINNVVYFNDIKINLSPRTKTFYDFLKMKENINSERIILDVVNKHYKCKL